MSTPACLLPLIDSPPDALHTVVRPARFRHAATAVAACLVVVLGVRSGRCEESLQPLRPVDVPASLSPLDPRQTARLSPIDRDRLYAEIAREAEFLERQSRLLHKVTQFVTPTVVHIDTKKESPPQSGGAASEDESGSGVITTVAGQTVVLTNRHVIHGASLDAITIRLADGRELTPTRIWSDAATDIGVMRVDADDLETARMAEEDRLSIGDTVLAVGSPFGLSHSVTQGIVSAKGRRDLDLGEGSVRFQDFIQTDAAINPGNSGGPLVNLRGEVVGLNTAIASNSGGSEGIGFAIPVSMVMFVAEQLVENGNVSRAYLGVTLDRRFSQKTAERLALVRPLGARVSGVSEGGPAGQAGLRTDDVILEYDGVAVEDDDHLVSLVSMTPADRTVSLRIFRDRRSLMLDVSVGRREAYER
jgi:serine protease Do